MANMAGGMKMESIPYDCTSQVHYINGEAVTIQLAVPPSNTINRAYAGKTAIALGVTQITIGIIGIALNALAFALLNNCRNTLFIVGYGFWCAPLYIIAGAFCVVAGKHGTRCPIITAMVTSILASSMAFGGQTTMSLIGLLFDDCKVILACHGILLVLGVVEGITAICASAFCCVAACCCVPPHQSVVTTPVTFNTEVAPPYHFTPDAEAHPSVQFAPYGAINNAATGTYVPMGQPATAMPPPPAYGATEDNYDYPQKC